MNGQIVSIWQIDGSNWGGIIRSDNGTNYPFSTAKQNFAQWQNVSFTYSGGQAYDIRPA